MVWRSNRSRNLLNTSSSSCSQVITDFISSEDSSESELVEEEKPWPPLRTSRSRIQKLDIRLPRPHSHLFIRPDGRLRGSKHSRRLENSLYLRSLHQIPEEDLEFASTILPSHQSPLTKLHCSDKCMQIWCSFTSCSETEQNEITSQSLSSRGSSVGYREASEDNATPTPVDAASTMQGSEPSHMADTPEQCFKKIEHRIRAVLRHNKHVPLDLLSELEEELCFLFSLDHRAVAIVLQTNAFCRLMLHSICQYVGLKSTTEQCGGGCCVVVVDCPSNHFNAPSLTLAQFVTRSKSK